MRKDPQGRQVIVIAGKDKGKRGTVLRVSTSACSSRASTA
jgi:ribosomal protein L24